MTNKKVFVPLHSRSAPSVHKSAPNNHLGAFSAQPFKKKAGEKIVFTKVGGVSGDPQPIFYSETFCANPGPRPQDAQRFPRVNHVSTKPFKNANHQENRISGEGFLPFPEGLGHSLEKGALEPEKHRLHGGSHTSTSLTPRWHVHPVPGG